MDYELNEKIYRDYETGFRKDVLLGNARRTVTKNGVYASGIDDEVLRNAKRTFSVTVDSGNITNQKRSGRCWMFAGLNVLRGIAIAKLNVKDIEFSQTYLQFFDKMEKANSFLDKNIELIDRPLTDQLTMFVLNNSLGDGGYWSYFVNLVAKYGIVPKSVMPTTNVSDDTGEMNNVLTALLHKDVMVLRDKFEKGITREGLKKMKKGMLKDVYNVLSCCLGIPPKTFDFEYETKDKENNYRRIEGKTPLDFYRETIGDDLNDYISISNAQLEGFEEGKAYYSPWLDNMEGGTHEFYFEVPLATMKKAVIKSLKNKSLVWFASDVLAQSLRQTGVLMNQVLKIDDLFSIDTRMKKGARLSYYTSYSNHAMTFTGVNLVKGRPDRWKVENSWGKDNGDNGYFVMDDDWFDNYVYQVIVKKEYLPEVLVKSYEEAIKNPVETEPYFAIFAEQD